MNTLKYIIYTALFTCIVALSGCTQLPKNVEPVSDFKLAQYLGSWYEIARLDHSFEQGLSHVTATYTLRDDGGIDVKNQGFDQTKQEWSDAIGKAYFVNSADQGFLKVSFFGPFYASYIVFETDYDQYAFVSGPNYDFLWLLSRTPTVPQELIQHFEKTAESLGFNTQELIYVEQGITAP